jgi:phage gp36-like protein
MTYCTAQDLVARFTERELIQCSDRANSGTLDMAVINTAIADACDEIDSYLRGRYAVPLPSVPPAVQRVACDIARYYLFSGVMIEIVQARYKAAQDWLKQVATGRAALDIDNPSSSGSIAVIAPDSAYSAEILNTLSL